MTTTRHRLALVALLATPAWLVAGCGDGDDGDRVASDPAGTTSATATATPTTNPTTSGPSGYAAYPLQDYDYTLSVACFCPGAGTPMRVSVRDGVVVRATYRGTGRGAQSGRDATDLAKSIQAIIDTANAGVPERVEVVQPAGQDWPASVTIEGPPGTADGGVGWALSDVTPVQAGG